MEMEKSTFMKKSNMISDENIFASTLCATENEHMPKGMEEKNKDNVSKLMNYDNWIKPKKCISTIKEEEKDEMNDN